MAYAKRLTKERLIQEGFTEITKEGRLFKGEREVFPQWNGKEDNPNRYLCIYLSQRASEGHLIKETFGLHRVMWAWHYGEVPEGFVVDHINNQHSRIEDYHLDNLQLLTPRENITKERVCNVKELKCKLDRPRTYYEEKLEKYTALYEEAKAAHDAKEAHQQRTNIAQTRARLRYWDSHQEEIENNMNTKTQKTLEREKIKQLKKEIELIKYLKKEFKAKGDTIRWRQFRQLEVQWASIEEKLRSQILDSVMKYCI